MRHPIDRVHRNASSVYRRNTIPSNDDCSDVPTNQMTYNNTTASASAAAVWHKTIPTKKET
jgi:hypothetical protein